jgi:hypothetical protein
MVAAKREAGELEAIWKGDKAPPVGTSEEEGWCAAPRRSVRGRNHLLKGAGDLVETDHTLGMGGEPRPGTLNVATARQNFRTQFSNADRYRRPSTWG